MAPKKILVVEDEAQIVRLVRAYLEQAGFAVSVARDGEEGLLRFRQERPDLVILDLMLPKMDGLDLCRAMRKIADTPIIMLTARSEEADKLIGLELGADDYITKPFSPRELVARVRVVLRRIGASDPPARPLSIGLLTINPEMHSVSLDGKPVDLTPTEFEILLLLAQHPGHVYSRTHLLDAIQGEAYEGYERNIDVHVKNLRRKIEADPREPRLILTVYGVGYKFQENA
jgi:DNA-binding response OmpR family regulator